MFPVPVIHILSNFSFYHCRNYKRLNFHWSQNLRIVAGQLGIFRTRPIGPWSWLLNAEKRTCRQGTLRWFHFHFKIWSKIIDLLIWLKIAIWHQSWYIIQTYMCFWVIVFGTSSSAALDGEGLAYKITDCQLRGFDLCRLCSRPSRAHASISASQP